MDDAALKYNGTSYSPYIANVVMATRVQLDIGVRLESRSGLLYYISQYENGTGNHILVEFINGIIVVDISQDGTSFTARYITVVMVILLHMCICHLERIRNCR